MYLIYTHNIKTNAINPIKFSYTIDDAYKIIESSAQDFIIEYEGKKKWDYVFIDDKTVIDKLKDGFYLINKKNAIEVYEKTTVSTINAGWIMNSEAKEHKLQLFNIYTLVEFDDDLLSLVTISSPKISKPNISPIPDKLKPNFETRSSLDNMVEEMRRNGFKPRKFAKK